MAALASGSTSGRFSDKASSSDGAGSSAVAAEGGYEAEEGVLDLDSPWVAATEAESRLEAAGTAAGIGIGRGSVYLLVIRLEFLGRNP